MATACSLIGRKNSPKPEEASTIPSVTPDIETIIVGAGVVGLAIARATALRGRDTLLIERNDRIGAETSSRNSEVIHAGIYYPPGSLKARMCVAGRNMLYRFAEENGVNVNRTGKLVVATAPEDIPQLDTILTRANANGVNDLVMLDEENAKAREPEIECIKALHSPSTGVVDSHELMTALDGHLTSHGGQIVLSTDVAEIDVLPNGLFQVATRSTTTSTDTAEAMTLTCRQLILSAGLGAGHLARRFKTDWKPGYKPPRVYPTKGHYFTLAQRVPFTHLIYPAPSGTWLGIHLTLDIAGQAKFGPDMQWIDTIDYTFDDPDGERLRIFQREVSRYWPGLPADKLEKGYTGIRPKIYPEGQPAADFQIHGKETHGVDNLIALYGIESPGLTSALALAEVVADRLADE
ncbi:MAG: NAD(P)/FAD-dependent oxidoreductase [Filomicrobium sp.]